MKKRESLIENVIRLYKGIEELTQKPYKLMGGILILVLFWVVWKHREAWFAIPFFPANITDFLQCAVSLLLIMCIVIFMLAWIKQMGIHSSEKDEENIRMAFSKEELEKGCPKLISKRYVKGTDAVVRKFYSPIVISIWEARRNEIEYQMSETFIKPYIKKGGNRQIIIYTLPDSKKKDRGILYDDI